MTKQWWRLVQREMEKASGRPSLVLHYNTTTDKLSCSQPGELTDKGRQTTLALGQRMRHLYVDQLGFMPNIISNAEHMYLRTTLIPRALESLQQAFWGMYPADARTSNFAQPTIVTRSFPEETLFPNESNCRRFRQLARLFAQRTADKCKFLLQHFQQWLTSCFQGTTQTKWHI